MTRHARNSTASAVYTYHEKQKDSRQSGYGSKQERLSKDSVKDFDCCHLTLQPCREPLITKDGYLYDKEAIYEYIIHKKADYARKMKAYSEQLKKEEADNKIVSQESKKEKIEAFLKKETSIVSKPINPFKSSTSNDTSQSQPSTSSNINSASSSKSLPSFWIPSLTPHAKKSKISKPDKTVYCPMSGKPLKAKDLIPVQFTLIDDEHEKALIIKKDRYKCAVTGDTLGNSVPSAILVPSGKVVTLEAVEKLIKVDMLDPFTGTKLKESDIIVMMRGGTGFTGAGVELSAKKDGPVMQS